MRRLFKPTFRSNSNLFVRRFVIVIPTWLAILTPVAIVLAVAFEETTLVSAFALIVSGLSAIFCTIAWKQVKEMRYALHNAINAIAEDEYEDEEKVLKVPHA